MPAPNSEHWVDSTMSYDPSAILDDISGQLHLTPAAKRPFHLLVWKHVNENFVIEPNVFNPVAFLENTAREAGLPAQLLALVDAFLNVYGMILWPESQHGDELGHVGRRHLVRGRESWYARQGYWNIEQIVGGGAATTRVDEPFMSLHGGGAGGEGGRAWTKLGTILQNYIMAMLRQDWQMRAFLEAEAAKLHIEELLETITGKKIDGLGDKPGKQKMVPNTRPQRKGAWQSFEGQWLRPDQFSGMAANSNVIEMQHIHPYAYPRPQPFHHTLALPTQQTPAVLTNPWPGPHTHSQQNAWPPRNILPHESPLEFQWRQNKLYLYPTNSEHNHFLQQQPIPAQVQSLPQPGTINGVPILRSPPRGRRGMRLDKPQELPGAGGENGELGEGGPAVRDGSANDMQTGLDTTEGPGHGIQDAEATEQQYYRVKSSWKGRDRGRRVSEESSKTI
ncbi:hypothetical protein CKM354_000650600 [Cercospora kikuchii]|uniref:Uncharacterized protein n=1 Tax=Cercospora kikuchii TaxID=84275 RepID=A0A9P3FHW2_9PEZI|nr:uncharacterized protein CKM354_000650600 [Cercospora kikuchii]GIZ43274.1 hypothetical protein CKM354_000650600 [Cercospora kikuchii]